MLYYGKQLLDPMELIKKGFAYGVLGREEMKMHIVDWEKYC